MLEPCDGKLSRTVLKGEWGCEAPDLLDLAGKLQRHMAKQKQLSPKYQVWVDARRRHKLSHAHIQMARELGMNPKKFGKLANHRQEPWKLPLHDFIEELYYKRFKKDRPAVVKSVEQSLNERYRKREEQKKRKAENKSLKQQNNKTDEIPF